jgi:superkiller protein 3
LWTRLGEAYAKSGKQVAALKALRKALELAPDSWICYYHIANIQHELGLEQQAIESLQKVMELSPDQPGVAVALATIQLSLGKQQSRDGFRARARINLTAAARTLQPIVDAKIYRPTTWKTLGEICVNLWSTCKSEEDVEDAMDALLPVIAWLQDNDANGAANVKGVVQLSELRGTAKFQPRDILKAGVCAYAYRVDLLKYDTKVPEIALYDLACALHQLANDFTDVEVAETKSAINAATLNIKKALDIDPTSPTLWNAFGSVAARGSPQLAQHAYIVALELEPKVRLDP